MQRVMILFGGVDAVIIRVLWNYDVFILYHISDYTMENLLVWLK